MSYQLADIRVGTRTIIFAPLLVAAITPALIALEPILPSNLVWLCYLMPVVLVSVRWGLAGAAVTAVIAGLAGDFFFTQPYYSLWMDDPRDVVALVLFLAAGFGCAVLITRSGHANHRRSSPASDVHRLLSELSDCQTTDDVIGRLGRWVSNVGQGRVTVLDAGPGDIEGSPIPREVQRVAAGMCGTRCDDIRMISPGGTRRWFLKQLRFDDVIRGTLVVETDIDACDRKLAEAALAKAAHQFCELARRESLVAVAEGVADPGFCGQWRTSLTTILGAASVLLMDTKIVDSPIGRALLTDIKEEAVNLSSLLGNAFSVS
jgi:K+-sensing histidine kinase KdpD